MKKFYVYVILLSLSIILSFSRTSHAAGKGLTIVLDPGHGGSQSGAEAIDGRTQEKDLNLTIARYLKEDLLEYDQVQVILTRDDDRDMGLDVRSQIAEDYEADLLVSLHNNAYDGSSGYDHGCFVLTGGGTYREELSHEEQKLACCILHELSELGIEEQGILLRASETGTTYPNGKLADYYRIIKDGILNNRMQVLIEHAYVDHARDFGNYLSSDESLRALARADARGIARYYGLTRDGEEALPDLQNYEEKLVTFKEGFETETRTEVFYETRGDLSKESEREPIDAPGTDEGSETDKDSREKINTDKESSTEKDQKIDSDKGAEADSESIPFFQRFLALLKRIIHL